MKFLRPPALPIILLLFFSQLPLADQSVTIAVGEWPPYISEKLPHYGISSHIVSEAFAEMGIHVQYEFYPWKRALELSRAGQIAATLGWIKTESREQDFWFSAKPVSSYQPVFHFHKDRPITEQEIWNSANRYRVGATRGYDYGPSFAEREASGAFHVHRYAQDRDGFSLLLKNKIDVFPLDNNVADYLLKQYYPLHREQLDYIDKPLQTSNLYLLFSRHSANGKQLKQTFDLGLKKLRDSGRLEKLQYQ